jgi:hypothetical protein
MKVMIVDQIQVRNPLLHIAKIHKNPRDNIQILYKEKINRYFKGIGS